MFRRTARTTAEATRSGLTGRGNRRSYGCPARSKNAVRTAPGETTLTPEALVEHCLDLMGSLSVGDETRWALLRYAQQGGELCFGTPDECQASAVRVGRLLQLIVASKEYQFA